MPLRYDDLNGLTLHLENGVAMIGEPQFSPVTITNISGVDYTPVTAYSDTATIWTGTPVYNPAAMQLLSEMEELGVSAEELTEAFRRFKSFTTADDTEETERSEELDEFLNGFFAGRQEVI